MKWAYGITTVPSRLNTTFKRTLESLANAGFDHPHLFVDGYSPHYSKLDLPVTMRDVPARTAGNWHLSLLELYVKQPDADLYAIFQDDLIASGNLRRYLESCILPDGYCNLFTMPVNQRMARGAGWFKTRQGGKGAVALVFPHKVVVELLSSDYMVKRHQDKQRGWRAVDGAIVTACNKKRVAEYCHNPSLVQHTGHRSSMGNRQHPDAPSFRGEKYDLMRLFEVQPKATDRIGILGYNNASGLGHFNRTIADVCGIKHWLLKKRVNHHGDPPGVTVHHDVKEFLESIDVLVFVETEIFTGIARAAKALNKRVVCVPMIEWCPRSGWPEYVDLFICPTKYSYDTLKRENRPAIHFPWPTSPERYDFRERGVVTEFLYCHGMGGWKTRKGMGVIEAAKERWPEMPLVVRSQCGGEVRGAVNLGPVETERELYSRGEVLLAPHKMDGYGINPIEAMCSGMPVITPNGPPWNEVPALHRLPGRTRIIRVTRHMPWYRCDPGVMVSICKQLLGTDVSEASRYARAWAEGMAWTEEKRDQFIQYVRSGPS